MNNELLHPDRLFPVDKNTREMARELYATVKSAPIVSPHGHTDPTWFSRDISFVDPVSLLIIPDHYVLRMLYSQGIDLTEMGVEDSTGKYEMDKRKIWRIFANHFHLFRGTPSALWLKHVFYEVFQIDREFNPENADYFFDFMLEKLSQKEFRARALYEKFNIEVLATTDSPLDDLKDHAVIKKEWGKRVIPTYRPDGVIDPDHEDFFSNLKRFGEVSGEDVLSFKGYLLAHRKRREFFKSHGATATDHGHVSALTLKLSDEEGEALFQKILSKQYNGIDSERFRAHMLWRMAEMSQDDGLVMQLHPGAYRNHNIQLFERFGRDKGADIPRAITFTEPLKPLLTSFGNNKNFKMILFTLDESTYSRELAPLAGHYPCLKLGPAWWFHDSPEGMIRHRKETMETAGFFNVTGFIDDTRAFFSIPARHDVSRRIDARILSELVSEHRLTMDEARDTIVQITTTLAKEAFNL